LAVLLIVKFASLHNPGDVGIFLSRPEITGRQAPPALSGLCCRPDSGPDYQQFSHFICTLEGLVLQTAGKASGYYPGKQESGPLVYIAISF